MYDYVFEVNWISTGTTAMDFLLVVLGVFIIYWAIKWLWSIVVGG